MVFAKIAYGYDFGNFKRAKVTLRQCKLINGSSRSPGTRRPPASDCYSFYFHGSIKTLGFQAWIVMLDLEFQQNYLLGNCLGVSRIGMGDGNGDYEYIKYC